MTDELKLRLERKHARFDREAEWVRFLSDAYSGCGGFEGGIRQPEVGWWGAAAEVYSQLLTDRDGKRAEQPFSYLDRFHREDLEKYVGRVNAATYWNFVGPLTDLKCSFMLQKPFTYHDQPDELAEWRKDVDGTGTSWADHRGLVATAAAVQGWTPCIIDMDPAPPGMSRAQARDLGLGQPRLVTLLPHNLVDYSHERGAFTWAKIRTDHIEQLEWDAPATKVSRYSIWTRDTVRVYEVRVDAQNVTTVRQTAENRHPFGEVPLVIFRHHRAPGDAFRGLPMHAGPARASRRLFNLLSELDEHMRGQVFAILVLARGPGGSKPGGKPPGETVIGPNQGLTIAPDASQKHYYLSPDPGIATTYENRIEATIREIYRMARVEHSRGTASATSGIARKFEFAQTNRAIADFAVEFARAEYRMDQMVWRGLGGDPRDSAFAKYHVQPPDQFDVEDLSERIKQTMDAISLNLGATVTKRLKMQVAERLDPGMPPDVRATVEAELEDLAAEEQQARALAQEAASAALDDPEAEASPDDIDEEDDEVME